MVMPGQVFGELNRLLALFLGGDENIGGLAAIGIGHHGA